MLCPCPAADLTLGGCLNPAVMGSCPPDSEDLVWHLPSPIPQLPARLGGPGLCFMRTEPLIVRLKTVAEGFL